MLRPWIKVARPTTWSGQLVDLGIFVAGGLALFPLLLVRLPSRWVDLAGGRTFVVRGVMLALGVWLFAWLRAWLLARLPRAPYLVWNTLVFADRGTRRRVKVGEVAEVYVELRPPGLSQVVMVELRDGTHHELCPVTWPGAGRVFVALSKQLVRRQRRDERTEAAL